MVRPHAISARAVNLGRQLCRSHPSTIITKPDANKNFISLYGIIQNIWYQQTTARKVYCPVGISLWSHNWFHVPTCNCHFEDFQNITILVTRRTRLTPLTEIYLWCMIFSVQNCKTNSAAAKFPLIVSILDAKGAETPQKAPKTPKTLNFDSKMTFRAFLEIISQVKAVICSCGLGTGVMKPPGLDLIHTASLTKSRCRQK